MVAPQQPATKAIVGIGQQRHVLVLRDSEHQRHPPRQVLGADGEEADVGADGVGR